MSTPSSTAHLKFEMVDTNLHLHEQFYCRNRGAQITINSDTVTSEKHLKAILPLLKPEVASIEFVRGLHPNRTKQIRGVFLLNSKGIVVVHIPNALIGYDGSGPALSRKIMQMFGFSEDDFNVINDAARPTGQHYAVVLQLV